MGPPVTCVLSSPNASGAAHGLLPKALDKPGGGSLARAGGLPELAYGGRQGHELHREEVFNDKSEQSHYSFWTSRPSRVIARTPGNTSRQVAGNGHVDRRGEHPRQRPHDPTVDAARGARGGGRLRRPPKAALHAEGSLAPRPARQRMRAEEARRRWPTTQPRADYSRLHRPRVWRRHGLSRTDQLSHRQHHLRRAHARGQPGKETAPAANRQAHKSARCSGLWRADQRRRSASEGGPSQYPNMPWSPPAAAALSASPAMVSTAAPPSSRWSSRRRRHECDAGARE